MSNTKIDECVSCPTCGHDYDNDSDMTSILLYNECRVCVVQSEHFETFNT